MPATLYKDLTKKSADLLDDDFDTSNKLKLTNKTSNGYTFTTEATVGSRSILSKLTSKFAIANGFNVDKLSVNTHGRINLEASASSLMDGLKVTVKTEQGAADNADGKKYKNSSKICTEYRHSAFASTHDFDLTCGVKSSHTVSIPYGDFAVGTSADIPLSGDNAFSLSDFGGAVTYTMPSAVLGLKTTAKCTNMDVSLAYDHSNALSSTVVFNHNKAAGSFGATLGFAYQASADTKYGLKSTNDGTVSACWVQQIQKGVKLGVGVEADGFFFNSGNAPKLGLQLTLG